MLIEYGPFVLAVILVVLVVWLFLARSEEYRKLLIALVVLTGVLELGMSSFSCWFFRDGLGPDALTSTGLAALKRFSHGMLPVWVLLAGIGLVAYLGARVSLKRINKKGSQTTDRAQSGSIPEMGRATNPSAGGEPRD
jgi:hypothetical protein